MEWKQVKRGTWELMANGLNGRAILKETNSGYIASISVTETEFDMQLLKERDFFEKRKNALIFLKQRMDKESY